MIVWQRRGTVLSVVLVAGAVAMFLSFFRSAPYRSAAGVRVDPLAVDRIFDPDQVPLNPSAAIIDDEARQVTSGAVKAAVTAELGESPSVSTRSLRATNVIEIRAEAAAAGRAAQIADAYASAYVTVRNQLFIDQVAAKTADLQRQVAELTAKIAALTSAGDSAGRDAAVAEQTALNRQLERQASAQAAGAAAAEVVAPAEVPSSRVSLRPVRTATIALAVGLLVGVALALLVDRFDDSVRNVEDLERVTGLPIVGSVPEIESWKATSEAHLVMGRNLDSPAIAAYERMAVQLRERIRGAGSSVAGSSVVEVTSPSAREGKTATVANLGVALARTGARVVIVCSDLRRPRLHEFFGLGNEVGFTSVILGKVPLSGALQAVPNEDGLLFLASGPLPPKPTELLSSGRVSEVLRSLRTQADVVLVDSGAALVGTDALVLAGSTDAVILVCAALRTKRSAVRRATDMFENSSTPLLGAVLNGAS